MLVKVLCQAKNCVYYVFKEDEREAYQHQCGNDEIEIDINSSGRTECFNYEKINT